MTNEVASIRKSLRMSRTELAKAIGVVRTTVMRWEKGEAEVSVPALLLMREMLRRHRAKKTEKAA